MAKAIYHLISEKEESFERRLIDRLEHCYSAILASAFFTQGASDAIATALLTALENGARVTFLLGRFDYVTEPRAVKQLLQLAVRFPKQLRILFDSDFGFHYKLAVFRARKKHIVIIGSSNLTPKGLGTEGEVNLEIVGNIGVYRQAMDCLEKRIKIADLAVDVIKQYERAYKRAQKFRRQRRRWHSYGAKTWVSKKQTLVVSVEPEGDNFTLCWIDMYEPDRKLSANIRKERQLAKRSHQPFRGTWVHLAKSEERLYREGKNFIVVDDIGKCFGFVVCTKKTRVLDSRESRELVIFYKFQRGWKFSDRRKYEAHKNKLFPVYKGVVGATVSRRLKNYFRKMQQAERE